MNSPKILYSNKQELHLSRNVGTGNAWCMLCRKATYNKDVCHCFHFICIEKKGNVCIFFKEMKGKL